MAGYEARPRRLGRSQAATAGLFATLATLAQISTPTAHAWGGGNNDQMEYYSASQRRDYLYDSKSINIEYVGCAWSYSNVDGDGADEDSGCLENSSEDGLAYWFMMSNCKRAQVVYNVYAGSGNSCSEGNFKETIVTKGGLYDFAYTLSSYDGNSPISADDLYDLPVCEQDEDGYYLAVGCSSSGGFTIERFNDQYCLSHYDTYYELDDVNSALNNLKSCHNCYSSSGGDNAYNSLCANLIPNGETCTTADSPLCTNFAGFSTSGTARRSSTKSISSSWANKFKYLLGSILLAASVMMFLGILFTNRRRRRAMMHRKFRQSASRNRKSSRSKSRSGHRSRSRSGRKIEGAASRDSKSRARSKSQSKSRSSSNKDDTGSGGVFT